MNAFNFTIGNKNFHCPKAASEGLVAAILLSFLSTAGLFYVNLGGAFLTAFVDGLGLSREAAGYVTSANKYGAAFGALLAFFGARYFPWRKIAFVVLLCLISVDLFSMHINDATSLIYIRFLHGTIGGLLVGTGFSVIARTKNPDKVFGMLLIVQYSFGSLGIKFVPKMVEIYGSSAVFWALIIFSSITLIMLPFLANYPIKEETEAERKAPRAKILKAPLVLALAAIFFFQAANMGLADYMFELGKDAQLTMDDMGNMLFIANVISIFGAVLVYIFGVRFGRAIPISVGMLVAIVGSVLFHFATSSVAYFMANVVTGIMWAFLIPYLLGLSSAFDARGQMAALAGFVSKMGLASGPFIAANLVGEGNFSIIINVAIIGLVISGVAAFIPARLLDHNLNKKLKI